MAGWEMSERGLALLRAAEGFSARVYRCPAGKATIGYGHVIRDGESFRGISREEADILLRQDVREAEKTVRRLVRVALTQGQFDALVCLVYNIGAQAFETSTLLRHVNAGARLAAAAQFDRWVHAGGRKLPGLVRRREQEKQLFLACARPS